MLNLWSDQRVRSLEKALLRAEWSCLPKLADLMGIGWLSVTIRIEVTIGHTFRCSNTNWVSWWISNPWNQNSTGTAPWGGGFPAIASDSRASAHSRSCTDRVEWWMVSKFYDLGIHRSFLYLSISSFFASVFIHLAPDILLARQRCRLGIGPYKEDCNYLSMHVLCWKKHYCKLH